jgi:hypothetical protein
VSPTLFLKKNSRTPLIYKIKEKLNQKSLISVKYTNDYNEIQQEMCKIHSEFHISCPSPSYEKVGKVKVYFSLNQGPNHDAGMLLEVYYGLNTFILTLDKILRYDSVFPELVSSTTTKELIITGNFLNNTSVKVKYLNQLSKFEIISVTFNNQSMISVKPPSFYMINSGASLMTIYIEVSFDGGNTFEKTNLTTKLALFETISIIPSILPENTDFSVQLKNIPMTQTNQNVTLILISKSSSISLSCNELFTSCKPYSLNEVKSGLYDIEVRINGDKSELSSNKVTIYSISVFDKVTPSVIFNEMKTPIVITGSNFLISSNASVKVKDISTLFSSSSGFETTFKINIYSVSELTIPLPNIPSNVSKISISISYNEGSIFHQIKTMSITPTPTFDFIVNEDSILKDATGFSFRNSKLKLIGKNFIVPGSVIKISVRNQLATKIWTTGFTVENNNLITFELPSIDTFNIVGNLHYPISFQFGLSFNDGFDYFEKELLYLDKYTALYLFSVTPKIIPRVSQLISIQGIGFEYVEKCQIRLNSSQVIFETNTTKSGLSNVVFCNITSISALIGDSILFTVTNIFNDTSNTFEVFVYGNFISIFKIR